MERVLTLLFQLTEPIRLDSKNITIEEGEINKCQDVLKMIEKLNGVRSTQKKCDEVMEELTKKKYIHPSELASYYLHTVGEGCHSFEELRIEEPKRNEKLKKLQNIYYRKRNNE